MEALARSRAGHKQNLVAAVKKEVPDMDDDHEFLGVSGDDQNKRSGGGGKKGSSTNTGGSASSMRCCQAERCNVDLSDAKQYHKRHKVCEHHAKAQVVIVAGLRQRFCQQCSRFHEVSEFDETKRSCRKRLAGHNERRRKSSNSSDNNNNNSDAAESRKATSSSSQVACGQVGDRGRIQISIKDNPTFEHFQIR